VTTRAAVFLDRDGTIVHDVHYLARPDQLSLMAGAVDAMHRMAEAGLALVVVTNQSGIGRGMFSEDDFARITARLDEMLGADGISLLATYHCPDTPDVPTHISCRKPGVSMYERAARDHGLDLAASFYVGDKWRDVAPAVTLGATGILVPTPDTSFSDMQRARDNAILATTLDAATDRILRFHAQRG
jgi:D-glycero-D-manno-heptose 1,7-bisphosphate phosphatase